MAAITVPSSPDTTKETAASADAEAAAKGADAPNDADNGAGNAVGYAEKVDDAAVRGGSPADVAPAAAPTPPSYFSSKKSAEHASAKRLLAEGRLDDALSALEGALRRARAELLGPSAGAPGREAEEAEEGSDEGLEMHESLAPLYYLYGTTLLYCVEESDVMMAGGAGGGVPGDNSDPDAPEESRGGDGGEGGGEGAAPSPAEAAEDLQIAWENLDLARTIVCRLVDRAASRSDAVVVIKGGGEKDVAETTAEERRELLLDLAQVHVRLGDLQRANACVLPCISDYDRALELRLRCLGRFDRRVADSHFSLAGACAEAPSRAGENEGRVDMFVSSLGGGDAGAGEETPRRELSEEEKAEFRARSLGHYLACGEAFAGMMARMCGEDPRVFVDAASDGDGPAAASAASNGDRVARMKELRRRLTGLTPQTSQQGEFNDLGEMMEEIQEAMETARETEEGLRSLGEMKANEIRKHEAKQRGPEDGGGEDAKAAEGGGAIMSIGFGTGSVAAAAATDQPATMMVIKKKKKKQQPQSLADAAKRIKTE